LADENIRYRHNGEGEQECPGSWMRRPLPTLLIQACWGSPVLPPQHFVDLQQFALDKYRDYAINAGFQGYSFSIIIHHTLGREETDEQCP
jgi:hypothetical protein